jgi:hypothetical protein
MAQTDDVICRERHNEDTYAFADFHHVEEISTQNIIDSLIIQNEDDVLTISETEQTISIKDDMGNDLVTYY